MLKIEAIKTTWDTLSKEDQLSLLTDLKFRTLGLCKETASDMIHPSRHIFEVCGSLSYEEYGPILQKYFNTMENVKSGNILVDFSSGKHTTIVMCTKDTKENGSFEYTNRFDWEENKYFTKNEFLNFCYGRNVSCIRLDGEPLALASFFKE